jgi:hypothetical protein
VSPEDEWRFVLRLIAETVERAEAVRADALQARSRAVQARIEGENLCAERNHAREAVAAERQAGWSWIAGRELDGLPRHNPTSRTADVPGLTGAKDVMVPERPGLLHYYARELAARAEQRAATAREHAAIAREQMRRDAAARDHAAEMLHRRETDAHARAARCQEQTAALFHQHANRLARR